MHSEIKAVETIFLRLLGFVVVFGELARRMKVPYPIVLVVAGLLLSFISGLPKVSLNPELFFLAVLPPLLFHAAWETSWRGFRSNLVTILFMVFGLVSVTVLGISLAGEQLFSFLNWKTGFLLGAILAPTDAVATAAIAKRVGLPERIRDILEGESLVNDVIGLLALEFGLSLVLGGGPPSPGAGALRLTYLIAGGIAIGLLIGWIAHWLELHIDDGPIESVLGLVSAYTTYIVAEEAHTSGVLAVAVCGFYLSRQSAGFFSPTVRLQASTIWKTVDFVLNGLAFLVIGLQLPLVLANLNNYSKWTLISYALLTNALIIGLRLLWVYPSAYMAYLVNRFVLKQSEAPMSPKQIFVTGWTGMRGALSLAAALSVPQLLHNGQPFPSRDLIIFLTFSVILVTLVLQGLSLPIIIRRLGLSNPISSSAEEIHACQSMLEVSLSYINARERQDGPELSGLYSDLTDHQQDRLAKLLVPRTAAHEVLHERYHQVSLNVLGVQREMILELRSDGKISDALLRKLDRELDFSEARMRAV